MAEKTAREPSDAALDALEKAERDAADDWMMNGIYPKRKEDTHIKHRALAIDRFAEAAVAAERARYVRIARKVAERAYETANLPPSERGVITKDGLIRQNEFLNGKIHGAREIASAIERGEEPT